MVQTTYHSLRGVCFLFLNLWMGGSSGWLQAHGRLGRALQKQQSQVTSAQSMGIQSRWKINVPQFSDIIISDSGKFLGWHLGRQSATLSFAAPITKFVNRVHEICLGRAPAAVAVIRYNRKGFPCFVIRFSVCDPP